MTYFYVYLMAVAGATLALWLTHRVFYMRDAEGQYWAYEGRRWAVVVRRRG